MMLDQCSSSGKSAQELFSDKDLSLQFFTEILAGNYPDTLALVDKWWGEVGDAKTILSQLATTLENLVLKKSGAEDLMTNNSGTYSKLVESLGSDHLVEILLTVSEWYPQVYSKPQLIMLTSKVYKVVNGNHAVIEKPADTNTQPVSIPPQVLNERFSKL